MTLKSLKIHHWIFIVISFFTVAFGQPTRISFLGICASIFGFAIFWKAIFSLNSLKWQFWLSTIWFSCVQCVQLSWMTSTVYQGMYIIVVYIVISFYLGIQFGITSIFVYKKPFGIKNILLTAAIWTLMEWSRLFILTGFSWNPIGLALGCSIYSLQMASICGVYGMSFWVILVNLSVLYAWLYRKKLWIYAFALIPFVFGIIHISYHKNRGNSKSILLVQTALSPEEKDGFGSNPNNFIHPQDQWRRILCLLSLHHETTDLIVLPEGAVPFNAFDSIYLHSHFKKIFSWYFGEESLKNIPPLESPIAKYDNKEWRISNAYWALAIANHFKTDLIIGLSHFENGKTYNSAFFFSPHRKIPERYDKRILVPMGEYIPFKWCQSIASRYGIIGSFTPGDNAKVFGKDYGISICYEETYGNIIRTNRLLKANMLVNITNDIWFANSSLMSQHAEHARLRTVENGIPLVRATNTGMTLAINCLGETIGSLDKENSEHAPNILKVQVPNYTYKTIYTTFGDGIIICIAMLIVSIYLCFIFVNFIIDHSLHRPL